MTDARKLSRDAVARLAGRLADDAKRLSRALLPGGVEARGMYRAARRSAGGPGDGLTVFLSGASKGKWRHFGGDLGGVQFGDMLDLIGATQRLDPDAAREWALRWLGLAPGAVEFRRTPEEEAAARRAASARTKEDADRLARARRSAKGLWLSAKPLALDNPAGAYLAGRIPGFGKLIELRWGLSALRYHPELEHPSGERFPALLALCQFPNGSIATVHRYYLRQVSGRWDVLRKARDGVDGKLSYCAIEGGFCPAWRGCRVDSETGEVREGWPWADERAGPEVVCGEGLENVLTLASVEPSKRYAAAISLPNFMNIKLPAWATRVVWFADFDGDNPHTPKMLDRALDRLEEQGRDALVANTPDGFKDANAALLGVGLGPA